VVLGEVSYVHRQPWYGSKLSANWANSLERRFSLGELNRQFLNARDALLSVLSDAMKHPVTND